MQELGHFIKAARENREITLREAEQLSGVSNSYLNQIENGKIQKPSPDTLNKLSLLYQVPYELLLNMAGYPQTSNDFDADAGSIKRVELFIVDDSANDRELIRSHLGNEKSTHYTITEAGNGNDALRTLTTYVPDCVLLDYHLPDMDGLEVFERMKSIGTLRDVSVIILTGHGNEDTAVQAMRMGAVNYLNKDLMTRDKLIAAVGHAIKRKHLRESIRLRTRQEGTGADTLRAAVSAIAAEIAAAVERILEKKELSRDDPEVKFIRGKAKKLLELGGGERVIISTGENNSTGARNERQEG